MTGISVGSYYINLHVDGRETFRAGKNNPNAENLQVPYISREGYERILRRLVLDSTDRIKWLTGTVVGFDVNPEDPSILSSVEVRLPDRKTKISAALVVGWYHCALYATYYYCLHFSIRLHRDNAGWSQILTSRGPRKRPGGIALERFKTIL